MLDLTAINCDGNYINYHYDSIDDLSKEYWSNDIDMDVPANDAPITECEFMGVPMYFNTFFDLITAFGIENERHYWKGESS